MLIVSLILLQIFVFIGLIFIFRKIMTENVVSATRHLEGLSQDYDKKQDEINRQLEDVKRKSQETLAVAQEEAQRQREQIIKEAQIERDNILNQARAQSSELIQQADKSRQLLLSEIDERVAKEAVEKACELIQYVLPEQFKEEVHSHWVEELIQSGFDRLECLRVPEGIEEIKVTSAFAFTEAQRKILSKRLRDILNRDITLKEEVDPAVVAGLVVNIGELVLDGSLRNKIQERAKRVHP